MPVKKNDKALPQENSVKSPGTIILSHKDSTVLWEHTEEE